VVGEVLLSAGIVNVDGTLLVGYGHSSHSSSSELPLFPVMTGIRCTRH
jgi:hypothetical protein